MSDLWIIGGSMFWLGLFLGYLPHAMRDAARGRAALVAQSRSREIERRLMGDSRPRHRSTGPAAVIRAPRIVGSKSWKR